MFNSILKCTFWVCMGFVCIFSNDCLYSLPYSSIEQTELVVTGEGDEFIMTIIGFEILIESIEGTAIITAVNLYDSTQQLAFSNRFSPVVSSTNIDISSLPSGHYILKIYHTTGVENKQVYLP